MLKIALTGLPGVGKSTSSAILLDVLRQRGHRARIVKLAQPLYDVQGAFYERMGQELPAGAQDGKLLNFLGLHFRDVSSDFLHRDLARSCDVARYNGATAVVCDDARPLDLEALRQKGFLIIHISAPDEIRVARKRSRGDRFFGRDDHPTERPGEGAPAFHPDREIDNAGTLDDLRQSVEAGVASLDTLGKGTAEPVPEGQAGPIADELLGKARKLVEARYGENRHQIGAALLTGDGQVFTGLHVEAMVGRASVCAEAVALGKAKEAGAGEIVLIVAVRHPKPSEADSHMKIVPPCGICRELLLDYGPQAKALVEVEGRISAIPLNDLLPHKYRGTKWG